MQAGPKEYNRLADEASLYLRQHADNPVHWYPWGDEALSEARRTGRPILLSIGYSACHWCHVMAHESFEDPVTATLMNARFINIKVDREERPDLDRTYQLAHQLITGRPGGWPLTLFIDPENLAPFFAGTYFPGRPRYGMPAFAEVLERAADWYASAGSERGDIAPRMRAALEQIARAEPAALDAELWRDGALDELAGQFDPDHGGFGRTQKFPRAPVLELLLASFHSGNAADMLERTLHAMADGGVRDHIGGGFFRYAVDPAWEIPHFEKMLYDNALLLGVYAQAWRETGAPEFAEAAGGIAHWALTEMRAPDGGFYSSLDADSPGGEGAYYTWTPAEIETVLVEPGRRLLAERFGLEGPANFEGRWHLHVNRELDALARACGIDVKAAADILAEAMSALDSARARRERPARDQKILTAWNGMMIDSLLRAGVILDQHLWIKAAEAAFEFIRSNLWREEGLSAVWADGRAYNPAYLDDYAWLLRATLSLLEVRWRSEDLTFACALAGILVERFADPDDGGFWFTANDQPVHLARPRSGMDDATPAGAAIAASGLYRLGELTGEMHYLECAQRAVEAMGAQIEAQPSAHAGMVTAAMEQECGRPQVVLRGDAELLGEWRTAICATSARPVVYAVPAAAQDLPSMLAEMRPAGPIVAYVCHAGRCSPPVAELDAVFRMLA